MKLNLPKLAWLTIVFFLIAGCFGPPKSDNRKEREREREKRERKHRKKNTPERVKDPTLDHEEDEENEKYDGIEAAQQREFDMTHDPSTNTIPKDRLINALEQRNTSIAFQTQNNPNPGGANGPNGIAANINEVSWEERGSNQDMPGPYGNSRDSIASTSGRIAALCIDSDPTKPNQIFVGGIDGGLWSCPDITVSTPAWTFIDNFSNLAISSICQDPTNPNIMYFGTGEHTINIDAVRGGGVWKSTNHGVTWTLLANTTTFLNVSKVLCDKYGNVYVATTFSFGVGTGVGLQRSLNGGNSWNEITPTIGGLNTKQVGDMVYDSTTDKMGVYMGYYPNNTAILTGFCYVTSPSTATTTNWLQPTTSATTGGGMTVKANTSTTQLYQTILTVKNGVFWALRSNYGTVALYLYRSTDGGATWTLQSSALSAATYGAGQGWYSIGLDCDPLNPSNNVMIGGLNVFKSTNGGTSFTQVSEWVKGNYTGQTQYVHADVHNIYYNTSAAGQNRVIVCSDGGVFYSTNGGLNWADRNIGLRLKQFYSCAINPSVPNYFLAGAQDNGSHQFKQSGLGASTEVTGGDGAIVAIDQQNPNNQITSYVYNSYYISKDGGNTWSNKTFGSSAGMFINPFDFDSKTKKMYAAYTPGNYLRWDDPTTTQNNSSVVSVSSVVGGNVLSVVTASTNLSNTIYVAGGTVVAKVVNANTASPTVTDLVAPVTAGSYISSIILGSSTTDQDIMITVSSYGATVKKVLVTTNGGSTWTDVTGNLPDMPVRWALFYPGTNTQAFLATEAGIWYTTAINGAATVWQPSVGFPAVRCDMIKYSGTNDVIAVGTHGRGLWTTKISTTPKISFYNSQLSAAKNVDTGTTAGCRMYADYSDTLIISGAPTGSATVTLSVQSGNTAVKGVDFDFTTNGNFTTPSTIATFNSGIYPNKIPVLIRVFNNHNKNASLPQTANLIYTVSGATDAVASPANQAVSISLTDAFPITTPLTSQTLWSENWENWPTTFNSWSFMPEAYYGSPANANALIPLGNYGCAGPISGITAQLFGLNASGGLAYCANGNAGAYTARMSRAVTAGSSHYFNMKVSFSYKSNGNNTSITNSLVYSTDSGTTWVPIASYTSTGTSSTIATTAATIPTTLDNTNYLLGWQSVGTAAATPSINGWEIDNIVVTGDIAVPPIDSIAGSTATNYETTGQNIDYYSAKNNIFANVTGSSADLACVTASIENAGAIWQPYQGGTRSQKTFLVTPTTNGSSASYTATFYFTNTELAGMNPADLRIAKTSASSIAASDASNTIAITPTTVTTYNSYGVAFTANFTGFSRFFLTSGAMILPITLLDFKAALVNHNTELNWITTNELNNSGFDIETSRDGINFVKLGFVAATGNGSASNSTYTYTHVKPQSGVNYYRLKQIDKDGKFVYTKTVAINIGDNGIVKPFLYPVPAKDAVTLNFGTIISTASVSIYSNDMKLIRNENIAGSVVTKDFDISALASGIYFMVVKNNGKSETLRFVKQ